MKIYDAPNRCGCDADITKESAVVPMRRGRRLEVRRAKVIMHYRKRDEARFWHWSDVEVVKI